MVGLLGALMPNEDVMQPAALVPRGLLSGLGPSLGQRVQTFSDAQRARWDAGDRTPTPIDEETMYLVDDVAGGLLSNLGFMAPIKAFHGSPHRFDRFSMDKIGTGEGAQAYGHGLYFAETPGVASSYRSAGKKPEKAFTINGQRITYKDNPHLFAAAESKDRGALDAYRDYLMKQEDGPVRRNKMLALRDVEEAAVELVPDAGQIYTTRLNVEPDDLLDWDLPLSQQSEKVRGALAPILKEARKEFGSRASGDLDGATLYRLVDYVAGGGPNRGKYGTYASGALREAGIPGIRYLDGGSRTAGEGTRNFVIFDDSLIDIEGIK